MCKIVQYCYSTWSPIEVETSHTDVGVQKAGEPQLRELVGTRQLWVALNHIPLNLKVQGRGDNSVKFSRRFSDRAGISPGDRARGQTWNHSAIWSLSQSEPCVTPLQFLRARFPAAH